MKVHGWDGNESIESIQWTFTGALFYSIIVITTIGKWSNLVLGKYVLAIAFVNMGTLLADLEWGNSREQSSIVKWYDV